MIEKMLWLYRRLFYIYLFVFVFVAVFAINSATVFAFPSSFSSGQRYKFDVDLVSVGFDAPSQEVPSGNSYDFSLPQFILSTALRTDGHDIDMRPAGFGFMLNLDGSDLAEFLVRLFNNITFSVPSIGTSTSYGEKSTLAQSGNATIKSGSLNDTLSNMLFNLTLHLAAFNITTKVGNVGSTHISITDYSALGSFQGEMVEDGYGINGSITSNETIISGKHLPVFNFPIIFSNNIPVGEYSVDLFYSDPDMSSFARGTLASNDTSYSITDGIFVVRGNTVQLGFHINVLAPINNLNLLALFDTYSITSFHSSPFSPVAPYAALTVLGTSSIYDSSVVDSTNQQVSDKFEEYESATDTSEQFSKLDGGVLEFDTSIFAEVAITATLFSSCVTSIFSALGNLAVPLMLFLTLTLVSTVLNIVGHVRAPNSPDSRRRATDDTNKNERGDSS